MLLVVDRENVVVASSELLDPLPGTGLGPGESLRFGSFEPLVHCGTGEPLAPGAYSYAVAQKSRDANASRPFGITERFGDLVITDDRSATRTQVERPTLPACGESIDGFTFGVGIPADRVTFAGFASWDHEGGWLQPDLVEGRPRVEYEFTYDGPAREHGVMWEGTALARDGVVVALAEVGLDGAQPELWEPGSKHLATLGTWFDCTADPEDYEELEAEGRYTVLGYMAYDFTDEWGLMNLTVATLDPVEVDFGTR